MSALVGGKEWARWRLVRRLAYPILVFHEALIVAAYGYEKQETVDVLEAVDPFFALRPLAAHVEHAIGELAQVEDRLSDARRAQPATEQILVVGDKVLGPYAVYVVKEAANLPVR